MRRLCAWCERDPALIEIYEETHGICIPCIIKHFPDEAQELLRLLEKRETIQRCSNQ